MSEECAAAQSYGSGTGWSGAALDTINAHFDRRLAEDPDRQYLDFQGEIYSFRRLDLESRAVAQGLRRLGVKKGDTVLSILDNGPTPTVLMFALFRLGAIHVGVNTALKGDFLRHQVRDAGSAIVVAQSDYAERILAIEDQLPDITHLFYLGAPPERSPKHMTMAPASDLHGELGATGPDVDVKPSDLALLVYTGGTTGPSKGCMISHNYACSLARQFIALTDLTAEDIIWSPLPNFHFNLISTTIVGSMMVGGRAAIYPRFSLSNFWPEIERTKATRASLMGAMLPLIAQAEDTEVSRRCHGQLIGMTSAPLTDELVEILTRRFGVRRFNGTAFGLTECSLLTTVPAGVRQPHAAVGMRHDVFDVRIFDDEDRELPPGEAGEIVCRPLKPHVMFEGYWRKPAETFELWRNGWFHTGDMGRFDEQGFMYFVDRKKDYLRRRGENISTHEMDNAFRTHPAIEDVAVHAVRSELSEDDVKATVVLREGVSLTEEELCRWAIKNLPYFAVPRYYEFRTEIPRSVLGRVLKYELRDQGVTAATFDMEMGGIKFAKR